MKKHLKGISAVLSAVMIAGVFSSCGESPAPAADETTAPAAEESAETSAGESSVRDTHKNDEFRDITAKELVSEMKIGWNLGNTLDATGKKDLTSETAWGNPKTSKDMIDMIADAGFNVIRIPVTWMNHFGEAPDYTIDEAWLDRVQEVVNYGIDNDMYVILNTHHEDWYNTPTYEKAEESKAELAALWAQIADRFEGYDEHLIFEGLNEPRLKGTSLEWNGGDTESRDVVNQYNAVFVETVRKSGGNNDKRILMVTPYAASTEEKVMKDFKIPEDSGKIIVSLHAYSPYDFALNTKGTDKWSLDNQGDKDGVEYAFARAKEYFLDKDIPVIIGEFGSVNKMNLEARCAHAEFYVSKAKEYGIPCVWWDNGGFVGSGENFGLLVRNELRWHDQELVDSLMKGVS